MYFLRVFKYAWMNNEIIMMVFFLSGEDTKVFITCIHFNILSFLFVRKVSYGNSNKICRKYWWWYVAS